MQIVITFLPSRSKRYKEAVGLIRKLPRYSHTEPDGHSCRLEGEEELLRHCTELDALVEIVHAWKGVSVLVDGLPVSHTGYRNRIHPAGAARGDMVGNHNWHYEEGLPLPFVHYPGSHGTFIGYAQDPGGTIYLCACVERSVDNYMLLNSNPGTWPKDFPLGVDPRRAGFRSGICHKCLGIKPGLFWCSPMYLSKSERSYGWLEKQAFYAMAIHPQMRGETEEHREVVTTRAKEEAKQSLGIRTGSKGENELYRTVCHIFPGEDIIRNYRPSWLEGLEMDIYVPGRKLAFEYQGVQHYRKVEHWGGEVNLERQKEHDARKKRLCGERGICLVEVRHDMKLDGKTIAALFPDQDG